MIWRWIRRSVAALVCESALDGLIDGLACILSQFADFKVRIEREALRQSAQSARIADQLDLAYRLTAHGSVRIAQAP
jgi:hypothetical protein